MLRRAASPIVLALIVGACYVRPTQPPIPASPPGPTPIAAASIGLTATQPTPTPTPAPTVPAEALQRIWSVERDGVRLTIELERNPMPAGETTWLTTTVTNTGNDEMTWFHDGCAIPIGVWGPMEGVRWPEAPDFIRDDGRGPEIVDRLSRKDAPVVIDFVDERYLDRKGSFGCADVGIGDPLPAGGSIVRRAAWNGFAHDLLGPPPTGLVHVTAHFDAYWRASDVEPERSRSLELPFDVWVTSSGAVAIDPAEAVDAALKDPRLVDVIEARTRADSTDELVRYDPLAGVWQVGLLDYTEPPRIHLVLVDPSTGALVGWVERIWDYDTDGFP